MIIALSFSFRRKSIMKNILLVLAVIFPYSLAFAILLWGCKNFVEYFWPEKETKRISYIPLQLSQKKQRV